MEKRVVRALVSVYDKAGLERLVGVMQAHGVEFVSTGGTWDYLAELGVRAERVEDLSGFPSILGGRVKTLHPVVFGGILAQRLVQRDATEMARHGIRPIDMVVVDLYPFARALEQKSPHEELIEKIDIGGVSLLRAAAKNFEDVLVVSSVSQYERVAELLEQQDACTSRAQRMEFAADAFALTTRYDAFIASYFDSVCGPRGEEDVWSGSLPPGAGRNAHSLRYGENPHQKAQFVGELDQMFTQLHGKELSYNNLLDLDAGLGLLSEYDEATVAILKHGTPCGLASAFSLREAWRLALAGDPQSAFGGVIVANRPIDVPTAEQIDGIFFEVILAPGFEPQAQELLQRRKNRVLLTRGPASLSPVTVRTALNGELWQQRDSRRHTLPLGECVTARQPTPEEEADLLFANRAVKHCKSNAIVIASGRQLIGVGAGERSRVDAVRHAIEQAQAYGHRLEGAVLASDAFFPFPDSIRLAAQHGIKAFVQPGGSVRDKESIQECDQADVSMIMTGIRHFKH